MSPPPPPPSNVPLSCACCLAVALQDAALWSLPEVSCGDTIRMCRPAALVLFSDGVNVCFLCSLLEKIEQETWRETGISFVTSVTRLVERLLDYRCDEI